VRYTLVAANEEKPINWLFLPGGPGGDAKYFLSLIALLDLPGKVWLVDLPGNGDNTARTSTDYNFDTWFDIFIPAVKQFKNPVLVGSSFGGMFPLCFPELEKLLKGFVILNSAPSLWLEEAALFAKKYNLPDLTNDMQVFIKNPTQETFKVALDACTPYYFPPKTLAIGKKFLADLPFQFLPAVWWQRKVVEMNFSAKWVPQRVPTLIVSAEYDYVVPYTLFQRDTRFNRSNIEKTHVEGAGHFPWIEEPEKVKTAFATFCKRL
jgi:pimeloyl-ACP methyl ester carboxylesterase